MQLVKSLGADATVSYKLPLAEQLDEIQKITGGKLFRAFDASAMATETGMGALAQVTLPGAKYFSTVNDW